MPGERWRMRSSPRSWIADRDAAGHHVHLKTGATMQMTGEWPSLAPERNRDISLLFLAKHANTSAGFDSVDGNHAAYHREIADALADAGFDVTRSGDIGLLMTQEHHFDYVFSLMNRLGFRNSEVLVSALCERAHVPYLGARPVTRAVADDKHYAKALFARAGAATPHWIAVRAGCSLPSSLPESQFGYIVKPTASAASWALSYHDSPASAFAALEQLATTGVDAMCEAFVPGINLTLPVFGASGLTCLPLVEEFVDDGLNIISHESKRGFAPPCDRRVLRDGPLVDAAIATAATVLTDFLPFDYGRVDFRYDPSAGCMHILELNISCNLQSTKAIALAAQACAISHSALLAGIVTQSLERQRGLTRPTIY
jgi:D-alanine-D-alanine ligase